VTSLSPLLVTFVCRRDGLPFSAFWLGGEGVAGTSVRVCSMEKGFRRRTLTCVLDWYTSGRFFARVPPKVGLLFGVSPRCCDVGGCRKGTWVLTSV
jgi:hypothetical protein